eukprot:g6890.t1
MVVHRRKRREALRGAEEDTLDLIFESFTQDQWAVLLSAPLERAAAKGERRLAQKLLEAGADIGDALHAAIGGGHGEIMNDLLEDGASFDAEDEDGYTPLHTAAYYGKTEMVQQLLLNFPEDGASLLDAKNKHDETPLHIAAYDGKTEIVQQLLLKGAQKDAFNADNDTPLVLAADQDHLESALVLLTAGADVNLRYGDHGTTVLHHVAEKGKVKILRALIENGADVDASSDGGDGGTALHAAAGRNKAQAVDVLIKAGANIEARDQAGCTPLHRASFERSPAAFVCLLKHGAAVNAQDGHLKTPLMQTAFKAGFLGSAKMVDALLRSGADETMVDDSGLKAADMIGKHQHDVFSKGRRSVKDVKRVRKLLANAPTDRVWRRRGYFVLCRAHPDRVQQYQVIGDEHRRSTGCGSRSCVEVARAEGSEGYSTTHACAGANWAAVVVKVVGLHEEGIFRAIVGYL